MLKLLFRDMWKSFKQLIISDFIGIFSFLIIMTTLCMFGYKTMDNPVICGVMIVLSFLSIFFYFLSLCLSIELTNELSHKRALFYLLGLILMCVMVYQIG